LVLVSLGVAPAASAVTFNVSADTIGHGYQLVTSADQLLNRFRLSQYLGLGMHDLLSDGQYKLGITTLVRFDGTMGVSQVEQDRVAGLVPYRFSIQQAYLYGRELADVVGFQVGRFLVADGIDFMLLDGGRVTLETPWYLGAEVIAGLEAREATNPITATQLELDGVRYIEGSKLADLQTIVVGASLLTVDVPRTRAKFGYRRLFNPDGKVKQEKLALAAFHSFWSYVDLELMGSYDLYKATFDRVHAAVRAKPLDMLALDLQYIRLVPSFDADSIFNIFSTQPLNDMNFRAQLFLTQMSRLYAGAMVRLFTNEEWAGVDSLVSAVGGMAGYYQGFGEDGRIYADAALETGYGGWRALLDVGGTWAVLPGTLELNGRFSTVFFDDELQPNLNAWSFGYQLGARYLIAGTAGITALAEHNFNRLHASQFRLYVLFDLDVWL
jgi:hypothetical protein